MQQEPVMKTTTTTMSNLPQANMPWPQRGGYTPILSLYFFPVHGSNSYVSIPLIRKRISGPGILNNAFVTHRHTNYLQLLVYML